MHHPGWPGSRGSRHFGGFCVYGQLIKTRRKDRVVKVERTLVAGEQSDLANVLERSEDSSTINTCFIERLNLSIRQGVAHLGRRVACHARSVKRLAGQLEISRLFYNFIRPHSALRFGREVRTPAQQAGLAARWLTWREIFSSPDARSPIVLFKPAFGLILGSQWRPRIAGHQQLM